MLGHRGSGANKPGGCCGKQLPKENTLESFERAFMRIDGAELDICLSKEGKFVISHNLRDKGTGMYIHHYSAAEL